MLNLLLLPIVDRGWRLQQVSHEVIAGEMHRLSVLLKQLVRMDEALVDYAIAIAGRPVSKLKPFEGGEASGPLLSYPVMRFSGNV